MDDYYIKAHVEASFFRSIILIFVHKHFFYVFKNNEQMNEAIETPCIFNIESSYY